MKFKSMYNRSVEVFSSNQSNCRKIVINLPIYEKCQDRCNRIGQTSICLEFRIESNILEKANQKRQLDNVVIQVGDFTTDCFENLPASESLGVELPGNAHVKFKDNPANFTAARNAEKDSRILVVSVEITAENIVEVNSFAEGNGEEKEEQPRKVELFNMLLSIRLDSLKSATVRIKTSILH